MQEDQQNTTTGPEALLGAWMEAVTNFWGSMAKTAPGAPEGATGQRPLEWAQNTSRLWGTLFLSATKPESLESLFKGIQAFPEIAIKMTHIGWDGYFQLNKQWLEKAGNLGKQTEGYKFESLDQDAFKAWTDTYESTFRKLLNVPQLGLTRFYQEKMNRAIDELNLCQGVLSEFLYMLYIPVEKSLQIMQNELEQASREGTLSENIKDYYNMWIKTMEGHYMTLFKSAEYHERLSNVTAAIARFKAAKEELLTDLLGVLPIPTNKEMDELYKEIYVLKKRLRELENKSKD